MAVVMGPPQLPAFSLRVQLFGTNAYSGSDKPIRCFRVVTSPDITIREFCEEVTRYHEENYGQPIAIKKCQDEEQFDVTQSEIVGNLFGNKGTIRIVEASILPGIRDSVPPTSVLRYDPSNTTSRKRQRESSIVPNGSARSGSRKPNKRQRLGTIDPDRPLPSRESDHDGDDAPPKPAKIQSTIAVPNSQETTTLGTDEGHATISQHGPTDPVQIPETPSPSPPPASGDSSSGDRPVSKQDPKITLIDANPDIGPAAGVAVTSAVDTTAQTEVFRSPRAKSTSYHIQRATERGASVSTAATTPLTGEDRVTKGNGAASDKKQISLDSESSQGRRNPRRSRRSENEDSIYEDVPSDSEAAAIMALKRASLRSRNTRGSGLPGLDFASGKLKTPPNKKAPNSGPGSRERPLGSPAGELQLTPSSKKREEKEREASRKKDQQAQEAREARLAAAQRRQEEAQASAAKSKREEGERIRAEESRRLEARQKERKEKEELAEEERLKEEKLKAEEKRREEERIEKERVEAERLRKAEEARVRREKAATANEAKKAKMASSTRESPAHSSATKGKPTSASRSRSSTPFIPPGRKSALKAPIFSSQAVASSPTVQSGSPDVSLAGTGIDSQVPLPKDKNRRISFADGTKQDTPMKPSPRILPPKLGAANTSTSTPKSTTPKMPHRSTPIPTSAPKTPTPKALPQRSSPAATPATVNPKLSSHTPKIIPPQWNTPILPPGKNRLSKERSATPASAQKAPVPQNSIETGPPAARLQPSRKSQTPIAAQNNVTPIPAPKGLPKQNISTDTSSETGSEDEVLNRPFPTKESTSVIPLPEPNSAVEISSDDSEEDVPAKVSPTKVVATESPTHRKSPPASESASEYEQDEDDEMASNPSSARESRSPVVFSQHPRHFNCTKPQLSVSQESDSDSESEGKTNDSAEESEASNEDVEEREDESEEDENAAEEDVEMAEASDAVSEGAEASDENEEAAEASTGTSDEESEVAEDANVKVPKSSPPILPVQSQSLQLPGPKPSNHPKSKDHVTDERSDTQEEIDQQLTSSMYEAGPRGLSNSPPNAPSSTASRPTIRFGASLQSLNSAKPIFGSSTTNRGASGSQSLQKTLAQMSDSDEESEEESDDDSSSSEEEDGPRSKHATSAPTAALQKKKPGNVSDDDSDSDDSSDSDSDSPDEAATMREQLAAQIADMDGSIKGSQYSIASPKALRNSTARGSGAANATSKRQPKKKDKYVSGYVFSQPV